MSPIETIDNKPQARTGKAIAVKKERNRYYYEQFRIFLRALTKGKLSFRKLGNIILCDLAYFFKIKEGSPSPYILSMELWNECNAGCLFCRDKKGNIHDLNAKGSGVISKGKMPFETATGIINQLGKDALIAVLYTNGEPLLYKDLVKVVQYATDRRLATMIASNGLLFTEENAKGLLEAGLDFIKIQLGGWTQEVYSIQIRYGEVEHLKENIRMLARMNKEGGYGTVILIDFILYNYNRHQLPLVRKFCKEWGLLLSIRPGNPYGGLEKKEASLTAGLDLPLKISCDLLWKVLQVNFNGDVLPCCEAVVWSGAKPYENLKNGTTDLKAVWQGKAAQAMRQGMNKHGRAGNAMCAQCARKGVCFKW